MTKHLAREQKALDYLRSLLSTDTSTYVCPLINIDGETFNTSSLMRVLGAESTELNRWKLPA
jgi:hypothetical protein